MNIRQGTTFSSRVKDENESKNGFALMGKRRRMGMRVLKRF